MCDKCDWQDALDEIDELLDDGDYEFATDTLTGIREWVEENSHVTEKQKTAVENIRESVNR